MSTKTTCRFESFAATTRIHRWWLPAACFLACAAVVQAEERSPQRTDNAAEWKVEIVPGETTANIRAAVSGYSLGLASVASDEPPVSAASGMTYPRMSYEEAYNSISFSRAEYEANPGYRHDAAMELMLGAPRPTTIIRQTVPYFSRYPDFIRNRFNVFPYAPSSSGPVDVNLNYSTSVIAY
jgi:hypothetical protein